MASRAREQVLFLGLGFLALVVAGTVGYMMVEGWGAIDSLFMTIITLTTVGYGEVHPLGPRGRVFTMVIILLGVSMMAYGATVVGQFLLDGTLARRIRRRRMNESIRNLRDHCIVCGMGRTGREAVAHLRARGIPFVVVERDPQTAEEQISRGIPTVMGSAHDNRVLEAAGIARARAVLACAGSDAENVFVTLTARSMQPTIAISCRCDLPESEPKLRRAGATSVVNPYAIAGRHLVGSVSRPGVFAFLESTVAAEGEIDFDELGVAAGSSAAGRSLGDLEIGKSFHVSIVALRHSDGTVVTGPGASTSLARGDSILALGPREQVERLRRLLEEAQSRH